MPVPVGFQAFHPPRGFVTGNTDTAPESGMFHATNHYVTMNYIIITKNLYLLNCGQKEGSTSLYLHTHLMN
jgi:hypothetical protein